MNNITRDNETKESKNTNPIATNGGKNVEIAGINEVENDSI